MRRRMIALNQQQQQRSHRLIMSASVARFLLVALVALWAFNMATVSVMAQVNRKGALI